MARLSGPRHAARRIDPCSGRIPARSTPVAEFGRSRRPAAEKRADRARGLAAQAALAGLPAAPAVRDQQRLWVGKEQGAVSFHIGAAPPPVPSGRAQPLGGEVYSAAPATHRSRGGATARLAVGQQRPSAPGAATGGAPVPARRLIQ